MKHLVFFFFICGLLLGQSNKTIYELPTASSIGSDDYFVIYDNGLGTTNKITFGNISTSLSSVLTLGEAEDYTWTGSHNFTSSIQLPAISDASLSNSIGFNGGYLNWVESGALAVGATRAWTLQLMADSGFAIDSTNYVTKDGNDTITGHKTNTGQQVFSLAYFGTGSNNGGMKIPIYTASNYPTANAGTMFYNYTYNKLRVYDGDDGAWVTFLDSAGVVSLVQTGAYLPASGALTGISSSLTFSSGGIRYVSSATGVSPTSARSGTPVYSSLPAVTNHYNGDIAQIAGETDDDGSGEELHGLYFLYTDASYDKYWGFLPDETKTQRMIDEIYSYDTPATSTASSDTLYFTDRNYIQTVYTPPQDGTTLFINDDYYGAVSIIVMGSQEDTPITWSYDTALTNGIKWVGNAAPTFDYHATTKYYEVLLKRLNVTTILGSWTYYQ